jgi:plastocyanin
MKTSTRRQRINSRIVVPSLHMLWVLALLFGLVVGMTGQGSVASAAPKAAPMTWTVLVGGEAEIEKQDMGPAGAWQFMRFYPDNITINAGDTIVFKLNSAEVHTVTFPKSGDRPPDLIIPEGGTSQRMLFNPLAVLPQGAAVYTGTALAGSGQLGGGPQFPTEYKLSFGKTGTYDYNCAFHPMMKGKVNVQQAGSAYPKTQAQVEAEAKAQLAADTAAGKTADAAAKTVLPSLPGPNGTTIHQVKVGYDDPSGNLSWMRFSPTDLTVHVGDTVEWIQLDPMAPHTITFTSGGKDPDFVLVEPQKSGPPKLVANPEVFGPVGGTTYSGKGYFNSGALWGTKEATPGPRKYSLTFDTPGTYEFLCALHDPMGMYGHITVKPKGAS